MKYIAVLAVTFLLGGVVPSAEPQSLFPAPPASGADRLVLTGTILTEGNFPPPESVIVNIDCGGREPAAQAYSNAKGFFSIEIQLVDPTSTGYLSGRDRRDLLSSADLSACELTAQVHGYRAEPVRLNRAAGLGLVNLGTIVLHPTTADRQFAVSVTSLAAPDKAKAAFAKGEDQKKKGKWAAAVEYFKKAIAVYPKYSLAWLELGRVQANQSNFVEAQQSFRESITQDSKLSDGYIELARLAVQQEDWHELASTTDHLVEVRPEAVGFWFLNAVANFNLQNTKQAEASMLKVMRLDPSHALPQTEFLYGMILGRQEKYESAVEHISTYLKLAPQAADAGKAHEALAEFQKRAELAAAR